ncbi:MAG: SpoIIE family protein phosphatase [Desulfovibrionaceae bacterium]
MPIRWKYFLALLLLSLVPLVLAGIMWQRGVLRLEQTVSEVAGGEITRLLTRQLEQDAENASKSVSRGVATLTFALRSLGVEAERLLSKGFVLEPQVYFASDYDNPLRAPADLAENPRYTRRKADGSAEPMKVSFDNQVFLLASGVENRWVSQDVARLSTLLPICRDVFKNAGYAAYRVYVSLESGVTMAYPGFGGYPAEVDTRLADWYARARETGKTEWTGLLLSRATGRLLYALNMPLYGPGGEFAGVAGIEAPVTWFLQEARLASQWSQEMRSFLVSARIDPESKTLGLQVMAGRDYDSGPSDAVQGRYAWMEPSDRQAFAALVERIRNQEAGSMEMDYQGRPSIWAFSPLDRTTAFLLVVPKAVAMTVPDQLRRDVAAHAASQRNSALIMALAAVLGAALLSWIAARRAGGAVLRMARAWERLAGGDFTARLKMRTGDERDLLVKAFNDTVPKLQDHMRLSRSMALAREVQQNLLPRNVPVLPGLDVAGTILFCDETGGDYYDAFVVQGGNGRKLALAVGDVSGHGAAPALLMATVRAMLRAVSESRRPLAERVAMVNRQLYGDVAPSGQFMTLFCAEFDTVKNSMRWVRAGHEPAWFYDPWTGEFEELRGEGVSLGFLENAQFEERERTFNRPGQFALLGTDGIWESRNVRGEVFGRARMLDVVRRAADKPAAEIVQAVLSALEDFRGNDRREDDVTLAVVKRI